MKQSLRTRILLIASTVLVVAMLVNAITSSYVFTRKQTESHEMWAQAIARVIGGQLERILYLGISLHALQGFERQCAEAVERNPDLSYAFVLSPQGEVLFHSAQRAGQPMPAPTPTLLASLAGGRTSMPDPASAAHAVSVPVIDPGGRKVADVVVGFRQEVIDSARNSLLLLTIGVDVAVLATSMVLLFLVLSHFVIHPLSRMVKALESMRPGQAGPGRLDEDGGDELAVVARSVNRMLARIERHEVELRRERDAAEQANRAKSDFLAVMSHEIRTPMHAMLGMSEVLLRTPLDPRQSGYAERIRRSGRRLLSVINDILDFSKIEGGHMTLARNDFDLCALLDEAVDTVDASARERGLTLECDQPSDPVMVHGDAGRLMQILLNLLGNALKFTPEGTIRVRLKASPPVLDAGGRTTRQIELSVEDSGIGVPQALHQRIFEPFAQADGSITRRYGGSGLGLSIVARLVELMHGRIGLDSAPGSGTRIHITLPLEAAHGTAPIATPGREPVQGPAGGSCRILLVEDDPVNQEVACALLEDARCQVVVAQDGARAVRLCAEQHFDLVLMDCHMPVMDGFTAARAIRDSERHGAHLPIIALTADVQPETRARCQDAGMDDYLAKPFDRRSLLELLMRWQPADAAGRTDPDAPLVLDPARLQQISTLKYARARGLVERAVELFIAESPPLIDRLEHAARQGEHATLRDLAHRLKSSSANVGAQQLSALAAQLEADARALTSGLDWSARIPPLRDAFDQACAALRARPDRRQTGS